MKSKKKFLNEIKFLWSASQKHGAKCAELRFILLMFHGIHPIEDFEADKLLRSSIYQRSIIGNEQVGRAPIIDRAFRIVISITHHWRR